MASLAGIGPMSARQGGPSLYDPVGMEVKLAAVGDDARAPFQKFPPTSFSDSSWERTRKRLDSTVRNGK
jgi:hypothetical protein